MGTESVGVMKRIIKFRYIFKHISTGNIEIKKYSLNQLEETLTKFLSPVFDFREYELLSRNQYTGLKDRNDAEIYEGDIVLCDQDSRRVVCYDIYQTKYKTVPKSTYYANAGNGGWTGFDLRWHCEVIGNVYEHPNLLEGDSK